MSKLNALKEKLAGFKAQVAEKADKIAFIKRWREKRQVAPKTEPPLALGNPSIGTIYREGSTFTRLQVILFVVLSLVAFVSAGSVGVRLAGKLRSSSEHEKVKEDITHEFAEVQRKHLEKAEMLALGQFTTNAYTGPGKQQMMNIDLWIRVSDPEAASLVNSRTAVFHDKTMDALNSLYMEKVSLLSEQGKNQAREKIRESLGEALPKGHSVEEVFIQNLVFQ